jgi:hypothetical protein
MSRKEAAEIGGGLAVAGRQLRRVLRTRALRPRRLPRTASPPPAATGPRRNVPGTARRELVAAFSIAPSAPIAVRRSQSPGRNAAHCPGQPLHLQGHPKILSNRFAESIFGTHPCTRSLCRPGGPDGEGQARGQARKRAANLRKTRHPYQEDGHHYRCPGVATTIGL